LPLACTLRLRQRRQSKTRTVMSKIPRMAETEPTIAAVLELLPLSLVSGSAVGEGLDVALVDVGISVTDTGGWLVFELAVPLAVAVAFADDVVALEDPELWDGATLWSFDSAHAPFWQV
jgi:hypothetical protein